MLWVEATPWLFAPFTFQPGPRDGIIQCFIKRDKSNLTYHLFLCLSPGKLSIYTLNYHLVLYGCIDLDSWHAIKARDFLCKCWFCLHVCRSLHGYDLRSIWDGACNTVIFPWNNYYRVLWENFGNGFYGSSFHSYFVILCSNQPSLVTPGMKIS